MTRILIAGGGTGGHLMPALALAGALRDERADVEPILVGATRGVEAEILPTRPYRHYLLPVEPIYRRTWWRNLRWPLLLWRLMRMGARVLDTERPALAVGTGGYAAGPILTQALRRRVPIALQEQNAYPGITTRLLASRSRQIHLGFPEARSFLRPGRTTKVFTLGNPIAPPPEPRPEPDEAKAQLGIPGTARVLFIMGGSQGARSINRAVASAIDAGLLNGITILWSTGLGMWPDYQRYDAPPVRHVRAFWDPVADAYAASDLVVGRAGAMTTAELCAWGLPSVLIPLPHGAADHQSKNAGALAQAGAAIHLSEAEASPEALARQIREIFGTTDQLRSMGVAARSRGRPQAARETVRQLLSLVS